MNKKNIKKTLFYFTGFLLISLACKKEQPEMNNEVKDPCDCATKISADFKIEESTGAVIQNLTETDTVFKNKWVHFTALEEDASYTWYIGTEELTDQSVSRFFNDTWEGYDIPITLVVEKEPNSVCFPNDDGYDSITKSFHVSQYPESTGVPFSNVNAGSIEGKYRVKSSHLPDSFDIELNITVDDQGGPIGHYFNIINYNGYGDSCINQAEVKGMNYRQIWSDPTLSCNTLYARIHNRIDGITEMRMTWEGDGGGYIYYYGRKIN
ncbi:MAG: hypothetical protein WEA99_02795 [Brumimicrobium sp.]